jgi:hypothetical protein
VRDLPAAVALTPAAALIETIAAGGYVRVHCTPAGWLPAGEVKVRFNVAAPFAAAVPDDNANASCADRGLVDKNKNVAIDSPKTNRVNPRSTPSANTKHTSRNLVRPGDACLA